MEAKIDEILKHNQLSVTGSRKKILELFLSSAGALAHSDIEKKTGEKFDRVTIYRTLNTFLEKGAWSMYHGYRKHHHSLFPLFIFLGGILFLVLKQIWHQHQLWFLPVAVGLIVIAHVINYRNCRVHNHAHSEDCNH